MSPTMRTTVIVGGALIAIALLIFCGQTIGRDPAPGLRSAEPPAVAAGPPGRDATANRLAAASKGAALGAAVGRSDAAVVSKAVRGADGTTARAREAEPTVLAEASGGGSRSVVDTVAADVRAAGTAGSLAAGAGLAGATAPGGRAGATPSGAAGAGGEAASDVVPAAPPAFVPRTPEVSAGPPATQVAAAVAPVRLLAAASGPTARSSFDEAYEALESVEVPEGKAVNRFAPPVAAAPAGRLALEQVRSRSFGVEVRQPCDAPGAGCFKPLGAINPPIRPGARPIPR